MDEAKVRQIIREELRGLLGNRSFIFENNLQIFDGRNIKLGTNQGTKIGVNALQKIGLWGVTPVVQPSGVGQTGLNSDGGSTTVKIDSSFDGNFGTEAYYIGDIVKALKQVGILKKDS